MNVLRIAILDFCRRSKETPFCPADIVRQMFPEDWELFIEDVLNELALMHQEGLVVLMRDGVVLSMLEYVDERVMVVGKSKPK